MKWNDQIIGASSCIPCHLLHRCYQMDFGSTLTTHFDREKKSSDGKGYVLSSDLAMPPHGNFWSHALYLRQDNVSCGGEQESNHSLNKFIHRETLVIICVRQDHQDCWEHSIRTRRTYSNFVFFLAFHLKRSRTGSYTQLASRPCSVVCFCRHYALIDLLHTSVSTVSSGLPWPHSFGEKDKSSLEITQNIYMNGLECLQDQNVYAFSWLY